MAKFNVATPPVSPNEFDMSMVLGTRVVPRVRSLSSSVVPKFQEMSQHSHHSINRSNSDTRNAAPLISPNLGSTQGHNTSHSQSSPSPNSQSTSSIMTMSMGQSSVQASSDLKTSSETIGGVPSDNLGNTTPSVDPTLQGGLGTLYVDSLVEKHARRILAEGKLRDLGKLAAHLDFHLVTWLRREKKRKPVTVNDFVAAIKMIHSEFEWPYPEFVASPHSHSRTPSNDSMKLPVTPEGTSPLKPLIIDVQGHRGTSSRNGLDSGYNSTPGNHAVEARLLPHMNLGSAQGMVQCLNG